MCAFGNGTWLDQSRAWCLVEKVLAWHDLKHRTLKPASGAHRPVQCRIADLSAHESGGHRTRPVPHKERPVTPRRAHKARAQGLRAAVSFSSAAFAQVARALTAAAVVRSPISRRPRPLRRARSAAGDLLSLLLSRDPSFARFLGFG